MTIKPGWQGRFCEDFEVGDIYQHPLGRTQRKAQHQDRPPFRSFGQAEIESLVSRTGELLSQLGRRRP